MAGRYKEMLDLLALERKPFWHYRRYGVEALLAMGEKSEALQYTEAYRRYGLRAADCLVEHTLH
jgi:hypothetical protein